MRFLLDTHLLVWALASSQKLPPAIRSLIEDPANEPVFSAASVWELAIKYAQGRGNLIDPTTFRDELLDLGYQELPITSAHSVATLSLPALHKDPFDRILIAQATAERIPLFTVDTMIARYPGPIRKA